MDEDGDVAGGQERREGEGDYRALIENTDEGFCIIEVLFDARQRPVDYRFLQLNPAFVRQTGLVDAVGRTIREMAPEHEQHWFDVYGHIALTGESARFEHRADALGRWYDVFAVRIGKPEERKVAVQFRDILESKQTEERLRASEARFRALASASTYAIYRMSPDWIELRQLHGSGFIPDTEVPRRDWMDGYIPPDDQAILTTAIAEAIRTRSVFELEHRVWRADGSIGWTLSRAVPLLDERGELREWFGAASDVTARHEAEEALRESEARQAFLLVLADWLRTLTDPAEIMAATSEALGRHLGAGRCGYGELDPTGSFLIIERDWTDGHMPSVRGKHRAEELGPVLLAEQRAGHTIVIDDTATDPRTRDLAATGALRARLAVPLHKDGRWVASLFVHQGSPRRWTNREEQLVREVAERVWLAIARARAEDERTRVLAREQEARREAERAMVLRDEFLAVISHELRTPLSAILLWSRMLREGSVPDEQRPRALAAIERGASAQKQLIEDLLDVSSMLSGKVALSLQDVALGPVLEAAVTAAQPMADARGVQLALEIEPCVASIDPERLQQVVWNLLTNAIKFTPKGGRVVVRLAPHGAHARLTVADTGQGIAAGFLPHVFERFRQQDASRTRVHGGLGLGLAIARELVALHGGTIAAASEGQGKGATFTVEIPRLVTGVVSRDTPREPVLSSSSAVSLGGLHILLVEDDEATRGVLQWTLEQQGAQVTVAASADEALAAFDASDTRPRFDVLVSDIGLPDRDGHALLAALHERPDGATLPSLALTAYARAEDRARALAAGFTAYASKPIEPQPLIEAVSALAQRA